MKVWLNQEVVVGDISSSSLTPLDISKGILIRDNADFVSGSISGLSQLQEPLNRSYNTSTTKNNNQTSSIQWQDISNSGCKVTIEETAFIVVTVYVKYTVLNNLDTAVYTNLLGAPGNGKCQNDRDWETLFDISCH